jgi:hypothetical protein
MRAVRLLIEPERELVIPEREAISFKIEAICAVCVSRAHESSV